MRIHIENLTNKAEDYESRLSKLQSANDEEIATLKREKRRLDDLLTIREEEILHIKGKNKELANA